MNADKIKQMLCKEKNCLNNNKSVKDREYVRVVGVGEYNRKKHVGEVLKDLDFLSENIVKYLNLPKIVKKKIYKK
jgi:hypothetical protein